MFSEFYIIRHGESDCGGMNHNDFIPDLEGSLTDLGVSQAQALGLQLAVRNIVFDVVFCSPKERAIQTEQIARDMFTYNGIDFCAENPVIVDDIRSRRYGEWEQKPKSLVLNTHNEHLYYNDPGFTPPGGESSQMVYDRCTKWLNTIMRKDYSRVAIFTHSKVFDSLHRYAKHLQNPNIIMVHKI